MICKNCGHEADKKAVVCTECGCKLKKPIYKKWWFWVLVAIIVIMAISSVENEKPTSNNNVASSENQAEKIEYEAVDLQAMFDALDANAMKAENDYQDKYIEFECKIKSFDSDGKYLSVEPIGASEWNLSSAMCYIKNDTQKEFLIQKNVGDKITVKGKIKSIGEVMGYALDINEIY